MSSIIDEIHEKRMALLSNFNKKATVIILGRKTFDDARECAYRGHHTVYRDAMDYNKDPEIFGVRVVVSNKIDEITVL